MFKTDQVLLYQNGVWGELGYAVPNVGDDMGSNNATIREFVDTIGRNLQAVMCATPDADLRTPPSINTLIRIHKLIVRGRQLLSSRMVPAGVPDMETVHVNPGKEEFVVYPAPYFKVRNSWLKSYAGLIFAAISEAAQHTENRKPLEISQAFAGTIGQYLQRVYVRMATELFMVPTAEAQKPDFTITDEILASYNPAKWFTSTEMVDRVPSLETIPTEDDLALLVDGIPASLVDPFTRKWPGGEVPQAGQAGASSSSSSSSNAAATAATGSFVPAPGP